MSRHFHDLCDGSARRSGDRPALRQRGVSFTFLQLQSRTQKLARGLQALGVRKGDRVCIFLGNRVEAVEIALACSRLGAIFVPLSPMLRSRQLAHILANCGAKTLFTNQELLHLVLAAAEGNLELRAVVLTDAPRVPLPIRHNLPYVRIEDLQDYPPLATAVRIIDHDVAAIFYTSGSTGRSKGVAVSHLNLVSGAQIVSGYLENNSADRIMAALPLSFDYGLSQVTTAMSVGACAVISNFSLANALLTELASESITGLAGVPTMWAHLAAADWPSSAQHSLRYITNSGGPLHGPLLARLRDKLKRTHIYSMYGLTEAFRSTYLDPRLLDSKPDSIGKAIPNQDVLVLRPDGTVCDPEEPGELVHRGALVAMGYWNDPLATAARFRPLPVGTPAALRAEIAVWSGDMARTDKDGFIYFLGRSDGIIKTSGYRVSPDEIEEVVLEMDGVLECVAIGVPDETLGQRIAVAIVVREGHDGVRLVTDVRKHCRMHMPAYMLPTIVVPLKEFPKTTTGKVDRVAITSFMTDISQQNRNQDADES